MVLRNKKAVYHKVMDDYCCYDTEINSLFFDFDVAMTKDELLEVYRELMLDINGDFVVHLSDVEIIGPTEEDTTVYIKGIECADPTITETLFVWNMKEFLESHNEKEQDTGWYRLMNIRRDPHNHCLITGIKLDFVA